MNGSWIRGSLWERAALRFQGGAAAAEEPLNIFAALRSARRILLLPNDRVGGLFIGAPLYKAVRQSYRGARIVLMTDEKKSSIARQIPFVDEIVSTSLDKPLWNRSFKRMIGQLRRERFDLALCLGPDCSFRLAQVCAACGARLRVGFRRRWGDSPFNIEIVRRNFAIYEREQYLDILRLLGLEGDGEVKWSLAQDKARKLRERYLDAEFTQAQIVAIDMSGGEGRSLSARQWEEIVGRIIERGARALLFFSLAEKKQVNYLKKVYGNRVLLFEQSDLVGAAALLEGCRALIACNTDLFHLAIGLQVAVIGLFDESPWRWVPQHSELVQVIQSRPRRDLGIAQVVEALQKTLRRQAPGGGV